MSALAEFPFILQESTDSNDVEINFSVRQGEIVVTKAEEVWERFWVLLQEVDEIAFPGRMLEA